MCLRAQQNLVLLRNVGEKSVYNVLLQSEKLIRVSHYRDAYNPYKENHGLLCLS